MATTAYYRGGGGRAEAPEERDEAGLAEDRAIADVVEDIGIGWAQIRACIIGSGTFFADGAEIAVICSVTLAVSGEWSLSGYERGFAVTLVFLGLMLGNLLSGPFGDRFGRRTPIIVGLVGVFAFSMISSFSGDYQALCTARFFVGFSFGIGQTSYLLLQAEINPARWRIIMQAITQCVAFSLGEIFTCLLLLSDPNDISHLNWRRLLQLGAIPAFIFAALSCSKRLLQQSPSQLAVFGQVDEARRVLDQMKEANGATDVSTDFKPPKSGSLGRGDWTSDVGRQLGVIFGLQYVVSTVIMMYSCFVLNLVYYGTFYGFAQVFPNTGSMASGAKVEVLIGALWELPGVALGLLPLPRKLLMKICALCTSSSLVVFSVGMLYDCRVAMNLGFYALKFSVYPMFLVKYQYASEIYPTEARSMGTGICLSLGRLGSVLGPMIFEGLSLLTGSWDSFFWILTVLCLFDFLLVDFLRKETRDTSLKDLLTPRPSEASDVSFHGDADLAH